MNTREKSFDLKKCIRQGLSNDKGLTIVEVMVAFVLVLMAIAMITTVTLLASRIQKQSDRRQQQTTQISEAAYRSLQQSFDDTKGEWSSSFLEDKLSNSSNQTLRFVCGTKSFSLDVTTADWTVEGDEAQGIYHIYK